MTRGETGAFQGGDDRSADDGLRPLSGALLGRVVAINRDGQSVSGPVMVEPGPLELVVVLDEPPAVELARGTWLRVGDTMLVEVSDASDGVAIGGLATGGGSPWWSARVIEGGRLAVGDPVAVERVPLPIEDALDLHPFHPRDIPEVVAEYLREARRTGLAEVRLIHGRGRGVQREAVRRVLAEAHEVLAFADAPPERGGWGATVVRVRPAGA